MRYSPITERKQRLRSVLPTSSEHVLYCDHVQQDGDSLFRLACENDLEGIVAKHRFSPYLPDQARWLKIRNQQYSEWAGREKFFGRERESDPDMSYWGDCTLACSEP